jgi:hypothetical protein
MRATIGRSGPKPRLRSEFRMNRPNPDRFFAVGQTVLARFTNDGRVLEFTGEIISRTRRCWLVKASLTSPYPNEELGRVFRIATIQSELFSEKNCIVRLADTGKAQIGRQEEIAVQGDHRH